jgi:hypothetical protein
MTEARYYRLKASLLEAALLEEQARGVLQRAAFVRAQAFGEAGLDPARTYELDDRRRRAIAQPDKPNPSPPVVP